MTTYADAVRAAQEHLDTYHNSGVRCAGLLEDDSDYLAAVEYPGGVPLDGEEFVFVSKNTGKVWTGTPAEVIDKISGMERVEA